MTRNNIILDNIEVQENIVKYNFHVSGIISRYFETNQLVLKYDENMENVPLSILSIPFVSIFMSFAWITNSVVWVDELDITFNDAINRIKQEYQDIYYFYPLKGRVVSSKYTFNDIEEKSSHKAIMLFSGGADAQSSLIRNLNKKPVLFNIQGWEKQVSDPGTVALADRADIVAFGNKYGFSTSHVISNFAIILNSKFDREYKNLLKDSWWHGFLHSMAFIAIAIPFAFKNQICEIIIASSLTKGLNHLCASNSTTDSAYRFANKGHVLHDGFELNRQNKIHIICDYQKTLKDKNFFMRVCSFNKSNCCECEKCFRTVLGIVAENSNPEDFGFNISTNLKDHWQNVMQKKIALMGFKSERVLHWPHIKSTMKANYNLMSEDKKEFVDWFLHFDFEKEKKKALKKYYAKNFFSILKRKLSHK